MNPFALTASNAPAARRVAPPVASSADDHPLMVADCAKRAAKLNQWEMEFIGSLQSQLSHGRHLSPRQAERLDEIWEKVTA